MRTALAVVFPLPISWRHVAGALVGAGTFLLVVGAGHVFYHPIHVQAWVAIGILLIMRVVQEIKHDALRDHLCGMLVVSAMQGIEHAALRDHLCAALRPFADAAQDVQENPRPDLDNAAAALRLAEGEQTTAPSTKTRSC